MRKYLTLVTIIIAVFLIIALAISCASPAPVQVSSSSITPAPSQPPSPTSAPVSSPAPISAADTGQVATTKPAPKVIPHNLAGRDVCLECHAVGCPGPDIPATHATYSAASCVRCHKST